MSYSYSTVLSSACDYVLDCASGSHWLAHVGVPQLLGTAKEEGRFLRVDLQRLRGRAGQRPKRCEEDLGGPGSGRDETQQGPIKILYIWGFP